MGDDDLWYEVRQLATADVLHELAAAWLIVGVVGVLLFIR